MCEIVFVLDMKFIFSRETCVLSKKYYSIIYIYIYIHSFARIVVMEGYIGSE